MSAAPPDGGNWQSVKYSGHPLYRSVPGLCPALYPHPPLFHSTCRGLLSLTWKTRTAFSNPDIITDTTSSKHRNHQNLSRCARQGFALPLAPQIFTIAELPSGSNLPWHRPRRPLHCSWHPADHSPTRYRRAALPFALRPPPAPDESDCSPLSPLNPPGPRPSKIRQPSSGKLHTRPTPDNMDDRPPAPGRTQHSPLSQRAASAPPPMTYSLARQDEVTDIPLSPSHKTGHPAMHFLPPSAQTTR